MIKVVVYGKVKSISNEKTISGKNGNAYPAMDVLIEDLDNKDVIYANCIGKLCEYVKKNSDLKANIILEVRSTAYKDKYINNITIKNYCPTEYAQQSQQTEGVKKLKEKFGGQGDNLPF